MTQLHEYRGNIANVWFRMMILVKKNWSFLDGFYIAGDVCNRTGGDGGGTASDGACCGG